MIKKYALLLFTAHFLILFSVDSYALYYSRMSVYGNTPAEVCQSWFDSIDRANKRDQRVSLYNGNARCRIKYDLSTGSPSGASNTFFSKSGCHDSLDQDLCYNTEFHDYLKQYDDVNGSADIYPPKTDEECQADKPTLLSFSSYPNTSSQAISGGCSYDVGGPIIESADGSFTAIPLGGTSLGYPDINGATYNPETSETLTQETTDQFSSPDYLTPLDAECTASSCVDIAGSSYLVDWDTAPDYFEYFDSSGTLQSKANNTGGGGDTGGGDTGGSDSGGDTGGGDTGGSDSGGDTGGDTGGSDSGGDTGGDTGGSDSGGSTVPDFEFDESGIIEAIGSSGQSNRNAINAMSGDITGAINGAVDSILEGVNGAFDGLVDSLTDNFTEDLGSGDDLFDSSGMDATLDGIANEEAQHTEDVQGLMDQIGEDESSGIAEQVTSRLPSLPSGGCTPLQFGPMEISCRAFNTIQTWLTWIVYFWTVVSIIDIFFRSETRAA